MNMRLVFVDIARALCVIWIVCFWHMNQYLEDDIRYFPSESFERGIALYFTDGILALFTLISGYFMSQKHITNFSEVRFFYMKRLLRFEIPLFVSCLCLCVLGYIAEHHVISICTGTAGLLPLPFPKILWYFSMIIMFYLFTPCLLLIKQKSMLLTIAAGVLVFVLFYLGNLYLWFDIRLSKYWPFFFIPFLMPGDKDFLVVFKHRCHYTATLLIVFFFFIYCVNYHEVPCLSFIEILFTNLIVCFLVLSLSTLIEKVKPLSQIFCYVSFASMYAYLFHREVYIVIQILIGSFSCLLGFVIAVFLFIISYYMQYAYNRYSIKIFRQ